MVFGIGVTRFLRKVEQIRQHDINAKHTPEQQLHFYALCALGIVDPNPGEDEGPDYAGALEVASRKQILGAARSILARRRAA